MNYKQNVSKNNLEILEISVGLEILLKRKFKTHYSKTQIIITKGTNTVHISTEQCTYCSENMRGKTNLHGRTKSLNCLRRVVLAIGPGFFGPPEGTK